MNGRAVRVGFALIVVAALAAGCASEGPSVTPAPEAPTPTTAAPTPSPTPTPSATDSTGEVPYSSFLPEIPRVSVQEVKAKLDAGANIAVVDSRPGPEYEESHIPGSISIPVLDMLDMLDLAEPYTDLDQYDEIMLYCT
jgi:hypothetical protein